MARAYGHSSANTTGRRTRSVRGGTFGGKGSGARRLIVSTAASSRTAWEEESATATALIAPSGRMTISTFTVPLSPRRRAESPEKDSVLGAAATRAARAAASDGESEPLTHVGRARRAVAHAATREHLARGHRAVRADGVRRQKRAAHAPDRARVAGLGGG